MTSKNIPTDYVKAQLQSKRYHVKVKPSSKIYKRAQQKLADPSNFEEGERVTRTYHTENGH
jgi:deoxycytidine triphosphate deaminase